MGTFGFEAIIKAIHKSFSLKKNLITIIHLVIGLGVCALLYAGSNFTGNPVLNIVFSAMGSLFMYYVLIRMTYILSFFALKEVKPGEIPYPEAVKAFKKQCWAALLVPIFFCLLLAGVIAVQVILLKALSLIPAAGSILNAVLFLPLFIINFFLLVVIFFGGSVVYGIMIEDQTGVWATIKAVISLIIRESRAVVIYWLLACMLVTIITVAILLFAGLAFIPAMGSIIFTLLPMINSGVNIDYLLNSRLLFELFNPAAVVLMIFNLAVIFSFLLSFLINILVGVNVSIFWAVRGEAQSKKR